MTDINDIIELLEQKIIQKKPRTDYDAGFIDGFNFSMSLLKEFNSNDFTFSASLTGENNNG